MNSPLYPAEGSDRSRATARSHPDPTLDPAVAKRLAEMPLPMRAAYLRAIAGTASPRRAIATFCLECVGWDRQAVRECTGTACPLWAYRPGGTR